MQWARESSFDPQQSPAALAALPESPGVFALYPSGEGAEPYLGRTTDLRRRLRRLLTPSPAHPRRLHLAGLVSRIAYTETASDLEATLLLYRASVVAFGERASRRMHLRAPCFLRMSMSNAYPRLYVTSSVTNAAAADLFGPFASRASAERYAEAVLDLFLLRHCYQDLDPDPGFPGCIYSEMKKCLAPCFAGCTDQRYAEEAEAVHAFLASGGQSLVRAAEQERHQASEALDFERAAAAHARVGKIEAVATLASEASRALASQYAVVVQPAHAAEEPGAEPGRVALYLIQRGVFSGPVYYSVAGMRHPNEQSGSSSLFAHPVAVEAVALDSAPPAARSGLLEERLRLALSELEQGRPPASRQLLCDHLAIFTRWYFRPAAKREGEVVFFPGEPGAAAPEKQVLRAISRVWRSALSTAQAPAR